MESRSVNAKLKVDEIPLNLDDGTPVQYDDSPQSEDDWDDEPILPEAEGTLDSVSHTGRFEPTPCQMLRQALVPHCFCRPVRLAARRFCCWRADKEAGQLPVIG